MAFDLVLKKGLVLDPSQDLHDIRDIGIQNCMTFEISGFKMEQLRL
jgi:hypothetical protein